MKIEPVTENGETIGYMYPCPGCGLCHMVHIHPHRAQNGSSWSLSGDVDAPSFNPSVRAVVKKPDGSEEVCHHFVVDGWIRFISDCTHDLANETVEMKEVEV